MTLPELVVIGVDPGGTTGIAQARYLNGRLTEAPIVIQTSPQPVEWIIRELLTQARPAKTILAVEKFIIGTRAGKANHAHTVASTHGLSASLITLGTALADIVALRSASEVKIWASNGRLDAAGFGPATGMPHARDALRHLLFAAVKDGGICDPLSNKAPPPPRR